MPVVTIPDVTGDDLTKLVFAKRLRAGASQDLEDDTKYAIVLLKLAGAVVPGDYPTLKTNIEAVTGIQEVSLLIDHQTRASVPAGHTQVLWVMADINLRDDTPEP